MGFFDLFSRGRRGTSARRPPALEGQQMSVETRRVDYAPLVPMGAIISNGDARVAADMTLLAAGYETFRAAHPEWCTKMGFGDVEPTHYDATMRDVFVYWLVGYDTPFRYGAYIDWKEATDDIVRQGEQVAASLEMSLDLSALAFSGEEDTAAALGRIAQHVSDRGCALIVIDTESDSYHLYLIAQTDLDRMVELGASVGFQIYSPV